MPAPQTFLGMNVVIESPQPHDGQLDRIILRGSHGGTYYIAVTPGQLPTIAEISEARAHILREYGSDADEIIFPYSLRDFVSEHTRRMAPDPDWRARPVRFTPSPYIENTVGIEITPENDDNFARGKLKMQVSLEFIYDHDGDDYGSNPSLIGLTALKYVRLKLFRKLQALVKSEFERHKRDYPEVTRISPGAASLGEDQMVRMTIDEGLLDIGTTRSIPVSQIIDGLANLNEDQHDR